MEKDWRILNQDEYLLNEKFLKINSYEFKKQFKDERLFHEHCDFCFDKIEKLDMFKYKYAYMTRCLNTWICPVCFDDFKDKFNLEVITYKYFILNYQRQGTFYHEFMIGNYKEEHWNHKSMLLDDNKMQESKLYELFENCIDGYDYYGITKVDKKCWERIKEEVENYSDEIKEIIEELLYWAEYAINNHKCFSILGI